MPDSKKVNEIRREMMVEGGGRAGVVAGDRLSDDQGQRYLPDISISYLLRGTIQEAHLGGGNSATRSSSGVTKLS